MYVTEEVRAVTSAVFVAALLSHFMSFCVNDVWDCVRVCAVDKLSLLLTRIAGYVQAVSQNVISTLVAVLAGNSSLLISKLCVCLPLSMLLLSKMLFGYNHNILSLLNKSCDSSVAVCYRATFIFIIFTLGFHESMEM